MRKECNAGLITSIEEYSMAVSVKDFMYEGRKERVYLMEVHKHSTGLKKFPGRLPLGHRCCQTVPLDKFCKKNVKSVQT